MNQGKFNLLHFIRRSRHFFQQRISDFNFQQKISDFDFQQKISDFDFQQKISDFNEYIRKISRGNAKNIVISACYASMLILLILVTFAGKLLISPPGWLAIIIVVLPYLYIFVLIILIVFLSLSKRKTIPLVFVILFFLAVLFNWGPNMIPSRTLVKHNNYKPLKVMVWNINRMGVFTQKKSSIQRNISCVYNLITKQQPDLLGLLEISYFQLKELQRHLGVPSNRCVWIDYYGTGSKNRGGLAACALDESKSLVINRKRKLSMPPNWRYVFVEILDKRNPSKTPINFLVLHIAPPQVQEDHIKSIVKKILEGKKEGLYKLKNMLNNYGRRVNLQGEQATRTLKVIKTFKDPTIVAGDFNSTRDAALHAKLRGFLVDTWSEAGLGFGATRYWGGFLPLRIDYIYVTNNFSVNGAKTYNNKCSDHSSVVSVIQRY